MIAARPSIITPAARALRPLTQLRCSLRSAARGAACRSRLGAAARKGSRPGGWGLGALSLLPDVVELATIEPGVRADLATQGGSTFTFDLRALIARTRPLEWPGASGAGVGWGGTSASPYCARRASDCAIFPLASACRASAFCIASRVARFSLLAAPHAPAPLGVAYAPPSPWSRRNRAPHSPLLQFS